MAHRTAYNPSDDPLVVDTEGRVIGGREWGTYDTTDEVAKALVAEGRLVPVEKPGHTDLNPDAAAAFERTEVIENRVEQVRSLDKDTLQEAAVEAGLVEEGENVGVRDLREAVAENVAVEVPKKSNRKREA